MRKQTEIYGLMPSRSLKLFICISVVLTFSMSSAQLGPRSDDATGSQSVEAIQKQLRDTISLWAGAWSAQLIDPFIDFYSESYLSPNFSSREEWVENRRIRIEGPDYIRIRLFDFELIEANSNLAVVRFTLIYERPGYSDSTYKELELVNQEGEWKISNETNIQVNISDQAN